MRSSIASYPDRGAYGNARYRGNSTGHLFRDLYGTWKNVLKVGLRALGGRASLKELYEWAVKSVQEERNRNIEAKIRQTLQRHFVRLSEGVYSLPMGSPAPVGEILAQLLNTRLRDERFEVVCVMAEILLNEGADPMWTGTDGNLRGCLDSNPSIDRADKKRLDRLLERHGCPPPTISGA